jgi:hypothetical protein
MIIFIIIIIVAVLVLVILNSLIDKWRERMNSGSTGDCTWRLSETSGKYTLIISGNGAMEDYDYLNTGDDDYCSAPWYFYRDCIETVVIDQSVTKIGNRAFSNCHILTSVTIGNSVATIGDKAFSDCRSLTFISVNVRNTIYSSHNGVLFNKAQTILIYFPAGKTGSYTIPNSVTTIGDNAFVDCSGLTSVTIGNSITTIGEKAFAGCRGLTSISVDVSNTIYSSLDGVLFDKAQAILIYFPEGKTGSYTILNSVTTIEDWAFFCCDNLTSVTIPNSVMTIGGNAFACCHRLTSISVDVSNTIYSSLDGVLFDKAQTILIHFPIGKTGRYTIPDSVMTIGDWAFANCIGLTSVTIPNSVKTIGYFAFSGCHRLTSISVDVSNTIYSSLDGVLFDKAQTILIYFPAGKAGSYTIPNSVTTIEDWAFANCIGLTSVTIPNSVTTIKDWAIFSCLGLTSVIIGNSVTSIGEGAFACCLNLTSITNLSHKPQNISSDVFYSVNRGKCTLKVPTASVSSYKNAEEWKDFSPIIGE